MTGEHSVLSRSLCRPLQDSGNIAEEAERKQEPKDKRKISVECSLLGITQVLKTSSHQALTGLGLSIINHRLEKAEGGPMHP